MNRSSAWPTELRWFSGTVRELYAAESSAELIQAATAATYDNLGLCSTAYEEFGLTSSSYLLQGIRSVVPVPDRSVKISVVESSLHPDFFQLVALERSPRECEVLHWVAQGWLDRPG